MDDTKANCRNCGHSLRPDDRFCPKCGQDVFTKLMSFGELLGNFFASIFNLDNTFFKTIKYLWAPWKLTQWYNTGRRKSFFNPMRLFLITLLFHFGYLVSVSNIDEKRATNQEDYTKLEKSRIYEKYLDVKNKTFGFNQSNSFADSLEQILFKDVAIPDCDTFVIENIIQLSDYPITRQDALEMPIDSIFAKYKVTDFFDKLKVKQMIRLNKDRIGMIKYAIGNAAWGVVVAILLLALFLKLLYIRRKIHYVSHLVFLLNIHSLFFILNTIAIFSFFKIPGDGIKELLLTLFITIVLPLYFFIAIKLNYRQGFFRTLFKFILISSFYFIFIFLFVLLVSLGSLIFF